MRHASGHRHADNFPNHIYVIVRIIPADLRAVFTLVKRPNRLIAFWLPLTRKDEHWWRITTNGNFNQAAAFCIRLVENHLHVAERRILSPRLQLMTLSFLRHTRFGLFLGSKHAVL